MRESDKTHILFVCFGGTCRSPLSTALATQQLGRAYVCEFAALDGNTSKTIFPYVTPALKSVGCFIDLPEHPQAISKEMLSKYDMIFCHGEEIRSNLIEKYPEAADKVQLYAIDRKCTPDPFDLGGITEEEIKNNRLKEKDASAYVYVARLMKNKYTPELITRIRPC